MSRNFIKKTASVEAVFCVLSFILLFQYFYFTTRVKEFL